MKQLIFILCCIVMNTYAQQSVMKTAKTTTFVQYKKAYKWEAYSKKGHIIFGVAETREAADYVIQDFTSRNWKYVYKPFYHTIKRDIADNNDYFKTFRDYCSKGYKVLFPIDITALRILRIDGLKKAALYYEGVSSKNYEEAYIYLMNLHDNFKPYRIR